MKSLPEEIFDSCLTLQSDSGQAIEKPGELPTSAGLILFADANDSPIQLLAAANIRRTVKNKLAEQKENRRADLKSITAKIYYTICPCRFRLAISHWRSVKKIFAQNYKDHITFICPAYIGTDLSEKIPYFSITKKPMFKGGEKILGPFPSQKSAVVFLTTLEDAFKLCKRNDLVNNPAQVNNCPYLQMDSCSGVCAGRIGPEEYKNIIKDAFEAGTNPARAIEKFQAEMQTASKELNFEKAAELKRKIEKLSLLKKQTYRWTGDLEKLKIVHIDKSAKIKQQGSKAKKQTFAVFVMNFFDIIDLGDFVIDEFDKITESIENASAKLNSNRQETCDSTEILEQFSIVSYFLYRTNPPGLWMNISEGFSRENLEERLKLKNQN
jgi:excinuclease UvrABC nuclease subunit